MDIFDEELVQLFEKLFTHQVKYILVGGFATNLHGYIRMTGDILPVVGVITNDRPQPNCTCVIPHYNKRIKIPFSC